MMENDVGRSPDGSGSRATHEAASAGVSTVPASIPNAAWIILTDRNFAIRFELHDYRVDFRTFVAALTSHCGNDGKWTQADWELFDGSESHTLAEWQSAFWEIEGHIKWDGCINWQTNPECMVHGCGPNEARGVGEIFEAAFAFAKRHFDLLGDEAPAMPQPFIEVIDAMRRRRRQEPGPKGDAQPQDEGSSL
jgi:hypothetical protein